MSRKVLVVTSLVFLALSLIWSEHANAQVRVLRNGRPWEIDTMAIESPWGNHSPRDGGHAVWNTTTNPAHTLDVRSGETAGDPEVQAGRRSGSGEPTAADLIIWTVRRFFLHLIL